MASTTHATPATGGVRVQVQRVGTFLSNMVMPNIGAFIAWGLITALFIEKGWLNSGGSGGLAPDSWVAQIGGWGDVENVGIVGPMITYLLPILIGYTGGKMMYDTRGGVIGAIGTMGVIAGTDIPMFMGAMIMGPLSGWSMKHIDAIWDGKIKPGFEMLVNNFAVGIWGGLLAAFGFFGMSPVVEWIAGRLSDGIDVLVTNNLLPFTSFIIEPAKVLFLNNALNHGVLTPLGTNEAVENGKSILFLLEANPGPGLGLLLAFTFFGKGLAKASAPGAMIIHFFGGIHEIYFPYVLMKPKLILAMIAGGMTQIFINVLFSSGLRAPAAPGSIIAVFAQTPGSSFIGVTLSVIGGAGATFLVAAFLLKTDRSDDPEDQLVHATASMESMKGKASVASSALVGTAAAGRPIRAIVFACDAGMGSSAMGASVLRKKVHAAGFTDVTVVNKSIANLTDTYDVVVTHQDLTDRAKQKTASAVHVSVENFMNSPRYDEVVELVQRSNAPAAAGGASPDRDAGLASGILAPESIVLETGGASREEAIARAGELLVASGAVDASYVEAMHEREKSVSTYMGNLLAIPHGTNEAKPSIRQTAISFVRYDGGVDWKGKDVKFVIGIAAAGDDHLKLLGKLAEIFLDADQVARLEAATSPADVLEVLGNVQPA